MVSVIIPAYNAEKYITRAINSVLKQTYKNYEIIVINDGSTDSTKAIVENFYYQYTNVILIDTPNGGVSRARNLGIDKARGEFIAFLDADDELFPDALEKMIVCQIATEADIVCVRNVNAYDEYANLEMKYKLWTEQESIVNLIADHPATYAAWGKIYRKDKLGQARFPAGKRVHEDSYFVFLCLVSGMKMAVCNQIAYLTHRVPNSASRCGWSDKFFDMMELAAEKKRILDERYPEYTDKSRNVLIKANMALLHNLCKAKSFKYWKEENKAIRYIQENKKLFVPAIEGDKRWFFIITHHLYRIYKIIYQLQYRI